MGKDFRKELRNLSIIYKEALKADISEIVKFLKKYQKKNFYAVGSGGSYTVASIFEELCIQAGLNARAITPLMLSKLEYQIHDSASIVFTASGSNHDAKNSYRYISALEPHGILTCCMRENAAIKKEQHCNLHNFYYEYRMPVYKDGYLAVESTISALVLLAGAFAEMTGDDFFLFSDSQQLINPISDEDIIKKVVSKETIIVLYGGITSPAAVDLESKFSEVSLGNIQLVDFRNFAHGRHFWLSDRKESTSIIALVGSSEKTLADKTLKLVDEAIPVFRLDVEDSNIHGLLDAFMAVFQIVAIAGDFRYINPGKPHIEDFGKKLYHINFNICQTPHMIKREKNLMYAAAYRKATYTLGRFESNYCVMADKYWRNLSSHIFRGLVFDYDGTVHDKNHESMQEDVIFDKLNEFLEHGIILGVATGRGKSVRQELQGKINKLYWHQVLIEYYNGGVFGWLNDDTQPNKNGEVMPQSFQKIEEYLDLFKENIHIHVDGLEDHNPYQLTILSDESKDNVLSYLNVCDFIKNLDDIRILESSHSMDIIPITSNKNNIFEKFKECRLRKNDFLVLGDSGAPGGNDYDLLKNDFALSVDYVSAASDSCWNFAKPGYRNLEAALAYLENISLLDNGCFKLRNNL